MESLNNLERAVLGALLSGEHPVLKALREQALVALVKQRQLTGAGFFTEFSVPRGVSRAALPKKRVDIGDVEAELEGLRHGAGFVLFVLDGLIHQLEGYSYDEPWPDRVGRFTLRYTGDDRNLDSLLT